MKSFCPHKTNKNDNHTGDLNANVSKEIDFKPNAKKCTDKRGNHAYRCIMCVNKDCPLYRRPINRDTSGAININRITESTMTCEMPCSFSRRYI